MSRCRFKCSVGGLFMAVFAGLVLGQPVASAQEKDKIPKKVMATLMAKFPKAEIHKWTKEKEGDVVVYDFEFKQEGRKFEADIKEDGTIHNWEKRGRGQGRARCSQEGRGKEVRQVQSQGDHADHRCEEREGRTGRIRNRSRDRLARRKSKSRWRQTARSWKTPGIKSNFGLKGRRNRRPGASVAGLQIDSDLRELTDAHSGRSAGRRERCEGWPMAHLRHPALHGCRKRGRLCDLEAATTGLDGQANAGSQARQHVNECVGTEEVNPPAEKIAHAWLGHAQDVSGLSLFQSARRDQPLDLDHQIRAYQKMLGFLATKSQVTEHVTTRRRHLEFHRQPNPPEGSPRRRCRKKARNRCRARSTSRAGVFLARFSNACST